MFSSEVVALLRPKAVRTRSGSVMVDNGMQTETSLGGNRRLGDDGRPDGTEPVVQLIQQLQRQQAAAAGANARGLEELQTLFTNNNGSFLFLQGCGVLLMLFGKLKLMVSRALNLMSNLYLLLGLLLILV